MIEILEKIQIKANSILNNYKHKKILFIGSESYDGSTITLIEGLNKLGFTIYTYKKTNINSWWCNTIIEDIEPILNDIDFVLSNLHWGTRWSLYKKIPKNIPRILIDADDRIGNNNTWKDKFNKYWRQYKQNPPENIKNSILSPYRWIEHIDDYTPDIIFMSQKTNKDKNVIYLPFGINDFYNKQFTNNKDRKYDFTNIPGPGKYRTELNNKMHLCPGKVHNKQSYGNWIPIPEIDDFIKKDKNVHSWHRWRLNEGYFNVLNDTKVFVFPGNGDCGFDSKRPWEALSCGCLLLFHAPEDVEHGGITEYSIKHLWEKSIFKFRNYNDLKDICNQLYNDKDYLEQQRKICYENAQRYFNSIPIAKYFLLQVYNNIKLNK